jgi:hypothetical protein
MKHARITQRIHYRRRRYSFMRSIAGRLADIATPSDADIAADVNFVLSTRGISTPAYLCDGFVPISDASDLELC